MERPFDCRVNSNLFDCKWIYGIHVEYECGNGRWQGVRLFCIQCSVVQYERKQKRGMWTNSTRMYHKRNKHFDKQSNQLSSHFEFTFTTCKTTFLNEMWYFRQHDTTLYAVSVFWLLFLLTSLSIEQFLGSWIIPLSVFWTEVNVSKIEINIHILKFITSQIRRSYNNGNLVVHT